jgi:addiction module RelE/StbE family toxin
MNIVTTKKFDKKIQKQTKKIQLEFKKRIKLLYINTNDPVLNTHKLSGGNLKGLWSFNLSGDIRIIFDKSQKNVIILVDVGSHSDLYS